MVQEVFAVYAYAGLCEIYGFIGVLWCQVLCRAVYTAEFGFVGSCRTV